MIKFTSVSKVSISTWETFSIYKANIYSYNDKEIKKGGDAILEWFMRDVAELSKFIVKKTRKK